MPPEKKADKKLVELMVSRKALFVHRDSVEKFVAEYDEDRDQCQLSIRIESLDRTYQEFMEVQSDIEKLDDPLALDTHLTERSDFETRFCSTKGFLLSRRPVDPNLTLLNTSTSAPHYQSSHFHLRLPKIDLPKFNGEFSKWLSFRDTFQSMVHSNGDIPMVAKLQYLIQSLEGEARKPFESVNMEADSYATVWDALLKRYDNRRFLKRQLFRAIYDLPTIKKESAKELHELVDEFQRHVRALAKLDEPIEHWDTPLVNLLSYKLDPLTLRAWEEKISQREDVTFEDLIEFLFQRVRILKSVAADVQHSQPAQAKVAGASSYPKKSFPSRIAANAATSDSNSNKPSCYACSERHYLFQCETFSKMPVSQRRELVSQKKLCWNCFRIGHNARNCNSKLHCRTCHSRHHTLLHDQSQSTLSSSTPAISSNIQEPPKPPKPPAATIAESLGPSTSQQVSMTVQSQASTVLLETVLLDVVDDDGNVIQARALLDSASMACFISKKFAKSLAIPQVTVDVDVAGIGQSLKKLKRTLTATLQSRSRPYSTKLQFLIIENPTADLPIKKVHVSPRLLQDVQLADPHFQEPNEIDLVIGAESFWELHTGKIIPLGEGQPYLVETFFGWTVTGRTPHDLTSTPTMCLLSTADDRLQAALQKFWELETIPDDVCYSVAEKRCEEIYSATTERNSAGRYVVRLPKVDDPEVVLGESRAIAERRFFSLERRLERNPEMKAAYHQFMAEYKRLGHMKQVCEPVDDTKVHCYLPHHPVFKLSSTTTKTRVVFDASCKTASGYSLNDLLLVGPVVQPDILSLVLRLRSHLIALVADVEKMYRQVEVHPDDHALQRILWRFHPSEPVATYELQTVTYGTASAPYLATKTLQRLSQDAAHLYPAAKDPVGNDFYVDDLLSGAPDVATAIQIRREVSSMLASAGFPLKKWASNSSEVLADVPVEDRAIQPFFEIQDEQSVSTLGLIWEPASDTLSFKVQLPPPAAVLTKRIIMSYTARIYDPPGLVGPTVTKAKIFMQSLWTLKSTVGKQFGWDDPLPPKMQSEWKEFHVMIDLLRQLKVPRFVSLADPTNIQLHYFADASEKAYGVCCYVRAQSANDVSVQLLASKSKVTPLSPRHSIARLELCAANLAVLLHKKVTTAIKFNADVYFWSDSTTVLQWLRSPPGTWKTFVANRVSRIQEDVPTAVWRHIAGVDNPADDISRGLTPAELLDCSRWWTGPSWLKLQPEEWPVGALPNEESAEASQEVRKIPLTAMTAVEVNFHAHLFSRCSEYSKLRRYIAFWLRYLQKLRDRSIVHRTTPDAAKQVTKNTNTDAVPPLNTDELQSADRILCRLAQRESFPEEYNYLVSGNPVSKSSALKYLTPHLDQFGLIRVGGRLSNANLSDSVKYPIVLSAKHPLSTLLATHYHRMLLHAGPQLMLSSLRQKFWILSGRNLVRRTFHQCIKCFRSKPTLIKQSIADLPTSRVTPSRPFAVCGIDYCGPFYIKSPVRNRGPTKVYVAIFVCFSTRAVHIELVSDLSTAAFLATLRRLVARRGKPQELHSDNATAFKGASHELHRVFQMLKVEEAERNQIFNWCANNQIRWKFIPPRAPHFGGLWEAAVKSAKSHLLKEIGSTSLIYEDLLTLLAQVEMCLNSRPLTPMSSEPSDLEALTPGHFLIGCNMQAVPELPLNDVPDNRLNHWQQTQKHFQRIWARWYPEYLQQLQARANISNQPTKIYPDRLVVVKDDALPPAKWPLGRILKTHPGTDGAVRVVTLKTASAKDVTRPVARIALLPIPEDPEPEQPVTAIQDQ